MSTPVQLNPSMYTLVRELSVPWGDVRGSSREKRGEVEGGEEIPDIIECQPPGTCGMLLEISGPTINNQFLVLVICF